MELDGLDLDDPELEELARKHRQRRLGTIAVVVAVIVGLAVWLIPTDSSVRDHLTLVSGHTHVEVQRTGIFSFTFSSRKGRTACTGRFDYTPGSHRAFIDCTGTVPPDASGQYRIGH